MRHEWQGSIQCQVFRRTGRPPTRLPSRAGATEG
jgi:hypothetical protein